MRPYPEFSLSPEVAFEIRGKIERRTTIDQNGCWLWNSSMCGSGYGLVAHPTFGFFSNGSLRRVRTHRASYAAFKGPIPAGLLVCHKCDVRKCVNPDHLFLGTDADNHSDMVQKGRNRTISGDDHYFRKHKPVHLIRKGEAHNMVKLTESQALEILNSPETGISLARKFGISNANVSRIRQRKIWRHL